MYSNDSVNLLLGLGSCAIYNLVLSLFITKCAYTDHLCAIIMRFWQYCDFKLPHVPGILNLNNAIKLIIAVNPIVLTYVAYTDFNWSIQACKHLNHIISILTKVCMLRVRVAKQCAICGMRFQWGLLCVIICHFNWFKWFIMDFQNWCTSFWPCFCSLYMSSGHVHERKTLVDSFWDKQVHTALWMISVTFWKFPSHHWTPL